LSTPPRNTRMTLKVAAGGVNLNPRLIEPSAFFVDHA
jgi:hypothetical protein